MGSFSSVYGPVKSWRYGRSLGIDPIGAVSSCSFACSYCQLGKIQCPTHQRQEFIATTAIAADLLQSDFQSADVVTISGSGEPTLALNLDEIAIVIKHLVTKPLIVLTNGTLLGDPLVCDALHLADEVSVKLDGVSAAQIRRVNHPSFPLDWPEFWRDMLNFRQSYAGLLSLQTMFLVPWAKEERQAYINLMMALKPDWIYLNVPTRPKPLERSLDGRGNHLEDNHQSLEDNHQSNDQDYPSDRLDLKPQSPPSRLLPCLDRGWLANFAQEIQAQTSIFVSIRGTS